MSERSCKTYRIVLTGGPGGGKSTAGDLLRREFGIKESFLFSVPSAHQNEKGNESLSFLKLPLCCSKGDFLATRTSRVPCFSKRPFTMCRQEKRCLVMSNEARQEKTLSVGTECSLNVFSIFDVCLLYIDFRFARAFDFSSC